MKTVVVSKRLQQNMNPRDAIVRFQCFPFDSILFSETISGERIRHEKVQPNLDIVPEVEQRNIFFANQADIARRKLRLGLSCVFNVYFREP